MKFLIVLVSFFPCILKPAMAEGWADSDAIFFQRFIPVDEITELHQDTLEWRVQRCILGLEGDWYIEFDLVGHEDAAMDSYVLTADENQPVYIEGQGWIPTLGFDIDSFCLSHTN